MTLEQQVIKLIELYLFEARRVELTQQTWQIASYPQDDFQQSAVTYRKVADDLAKILARYYIENKLDVTTTCRQVKEAIRREESRSLWEKIFTHERPTTIPETR